MAPLFVYTQQAALAALAAAQAADAEELFVNNENAIFPSSLMDILNGDFTSRETKNGGLNFTALKPKHPIIFQNIGLSYKAKDFTKMGIDAEFLKSKGISEETLMRIGLL